MRALSKHYLIDGLGLPVPDAPVAVKYKDIEGESARDRSGLLHRTVLRRVRSWEFSYDRLGNEDKEYLQSILDTGVIHFIHPEGNCICCCRGFTVEHYDAAAGIWRNFRFQVEEV